MTKPRPREIRRDPEKGRIAGVCAGIANYFGWELWLVRIIALSGLFLSGSLFFIGYIAAWVILEKKPPGEYRQQANNGEDAVHFELKSRVWQAGEPPKAAFAEIRSTFDKLEARLQRLERHVTSKQFSVAREINKL